MLEHLIKEKAYEIWEAEGYPDGRAEVHWELAKAELARKTIGREVTRKRASGRKSKRGMVET